MNIWLINHYAVPPQYYPLARQTYFAKYLMEMGHSVTIFAASTVHNSNQNLITDGAPYREETVNGVHYVYIRCRDYTGNGVSRIYNMMEFAWKLPGVCKRFPRPDAIVATSMPPVSCAAGIRIARKYGCRGIAEIADLWPESIVAYGIAGKNNPLVVLLRRLEKWIYKKSDAVVFTMEGGYDYIIEQGWEKEIPRSKVFHINNGVDLISFYNNRENNRIQDSDLSDPHTFKVIYTGSVRRVNNLGLLLEAAKKVKNRRIKFLIWGDGDEFLGLKKKVEDEKIENVCFKGKVNKACIPYIVSCADLNIVHNTPTKLLRFGISMNKIFDYFAAGKPMVVDFPCRYNPVIQYQAGIMVEDPEASNIAAAIESFASMDKSEYDTYCDHSLAAAHEYDFKRLTQKLMDVIEGRRE